MDSSVLYELFYTWLNGKVSFLGCIVWILLSLVWYKLSFIQLNGIVSYMYGCTFVECYELFYTWL